MTNKLHTLFKILSGNAFAQIIVIITTPMLTRLYNPTDFGGLAIANAILLIIGVIGCFRYDQIIFKYNDYKEWNYCYNNGFFISISVSIILFFVLLIFNFYFDFDYYQYLISIPLLVLSFSLSQLYSSLISVNGKYTIISNSLIIRSFTIFSSQYLLYDYFSASGLIYGLVIGQLVQAFFLYFIVRKNNKFKIDIRNITRISQESYLSTGQSLSNSFSSQLPSLLIPYKFGLELMGYYSMALRLTYIPITFFTNAIRPFLLGELNNNIDNKEKTYKLLAYGSSLLLIVGLLGVLLINVFSKEFFLLYAGNDWVVSGDISNIISFWIMLAFSNILATSYLTVYSKFKQLFIYDSVLLIFRCFIVLFVFILHIDFWLFIKLYSIVGFSFNISIIFYAIWLGKNEKNIISNNT